MVNKRRDIATKDENGKLAKKVIEYYSGEAPESAVLIKVEIFSKTDKGWTHRDITNQEGIDGYVAEGA